jgi:hypothetical protein
MVIFIMRLHVLRRYCSIGPLKNETGNFISCKAASDAFLPLIEGQFLTLSFVRGAYCV